VTRFTSRSLPVGWFTDLSAKFLGIRTAKLLVLAGTDRLDKPMMIGQMQGNLSAIS
jgi:protein phosphatase methylesterase 1